MRCTSSISSSPCTSSACLRNWRTIHAWARIRLIRSMAASGVMAEVLLRLAPAWRRAGAKRNLYLQIANVRFDRRDLRLQVGDLLAQLLHDFRRGILHEVRVLQLRLRGLQVLALLGKLFF